MFYVIVNASSMVQQVIQIKNGIVINANVSIKELGILANVFVRIVDI